VFYKKGSGRVCPDYAQIRAATYSRNDWTFRALTAALVLPEIEHLNAINFTGRQSAIKEAENYTHFYNDKRNHSGIDYIAGTPSEILCVNSSLDSYYI